MDITRALAGRVVRSVLRNDVSIVIRCDDGFEMQLGWVDDNGKPIKGTPVIAFAGKRILVNPSAKPDVQNAREVGLRTGLGMRR